MAVKVESPYRGQWGCLLPALLPAGWGCPPLCRAQQLLVTLIQDMAQQSTTARKVRQPARPAQVPDVGPAWRPCQLSPPASPSSHHLQEGPSPPLLPHVWRGQATVRGGDLCVSPPRAPANLHLAHTTPARTFFYVQICRVCSLRGTPSHPFCCPSAPRRYSEAGSLLVP